MLLAPIKLVTSPNPNDNNMIAKVAFGGELRKLKSIVIRLWIIVQIPSMSL